MTIDHREWRYSNADRCGSCLERAVIPTREIAERFVAKSEGRLVVEVCPAGYGWHLGYPAVEHAHH